MTSILASRVVTRLLAIDVGTPAQPPGTGKITTLFQWAGWGVTAACAFGVFIVAGMMAIRHRRGEEGGEHLGRLGWVGLAAILGTAVGPIINALTGG